VKPIAPARRSFAPCAPAARAARSTPTALLRGALIVGLLGAPGIGASGTASADEVPVFQTPPPAGELADMLFPENTRSLATRSIVIDEPEDGLPGTEGSSPQAGAVAIGATTGATGKDSAGGDAPSGFGLLVNFAFGQANVLPESIASLDTVGEMLNLPQAQGQAIIIEGHTDAIGGADYNQTLSEQRALAVRRYLVSVHGIEQSRLHPVGRGESALHDAADPRAATNRRVEFRRLDRQGG